MARGIFTLKQQLQGLQQRAWSGTITTPAVDYLVVAGGGSGSGAGGGAGGLLQGSVPVTAGTSYTVTVGGGGSSANGQNSVFGSITALGGGLGGTGFSATNNSGFAGGSGGGGSFGRSVYSEPFGSGGQGVFGQGNAGASGWTNNPADSSQLQTSGGGGAGTAGFVGNATIAGAGGAGIASAINGTVTVYAGGGGGGTYTGSLSTTGQGGVGGGGRGGHTGNNAVAGTANTGGGGGGALGYSAGAGGSGIVIISYPDVYAAAAATTGSPTVSTSGSGSLLFNGSSSFLYGTTLSNLALGTGDFTVEGWFYQTADNTYPIALEIGDHGASSGVAFMTKYSGNATLYSGGFYGTQATTLNAWNHIAWVRASGVLKIYVNGIGGTGVSFTNNLTVASNVSIGRTYYYNPTNYWYTGSISNFRVVKGTAVYTTNFTPSTIPLTVITNTQLLMNSVSGALFADSSTNAYTFTTSSAPTWNQASPFATGLGYKNRVYTWTSSGSITF